MPVEFITGRPGGGKSLKAVEYIIECLAYEKLYVVTNIPLKLGPLNEYLQRKFPEKRIDLTERLRVIDSEEACCHFRFRSGGFELPMPPAEVVEVNGKKHKLTNAEFNRSMEKYFGQINNAVEQGIPANIGVKYFIDEVHDIYGARQWANTQQANIWYFTKHRHLGDENVLITQNLKQVDSQLRELGTKYHEVCDLRVRKALGFFRQRSGADFQQKTFNQPPNRQARAEEIRIYRLDVKGIASCYQTVGASGINGVKPTEVKKPRALPMWSLPLIVAAGVGLFFFAIWSVGQLSVAAISSGTNFSTEQLSGQSASSGSSPSKSSSTSSRKSVDSETGESVVQKQTYLLNYRFWRLSGQPFWIAELSDGRIISSSLQGWTFSKIPYVRIRNPAGSEFVYLGKEMVPDHLEQLRKDTQVRFLNQKEEYEDNMQPEQEEPMQSTSNQQMPTFGGNYIGGQAPTVSKQGFIQ